MRCGDNKFCEQPGGATAARVAGSSTRSLPMFLSANCKHFYYMSNMGDVRHVVLP
jgi:hypothetical protein